MNYPMLALDEGAAHIGYAAQCAIQSAIIANLERKPPALRKARIIELYSDGVLSRGQVNAFFNLWSLHHL